MNNKEYTHIMDAIELVHRENIALAGLIVKMFAKPEQAEKYLDEVEKKWQEVFNDVRRGGW